MSDLETRIASRLADVRARIAQAAERVGRDPAGIRLVAVSKTHGPDHVAAAVAAGQLDFGENKVQEGLQKIAQLADSTIRWHLIGHLQANKARKAGEAFHWIHAVDGVELLQKLDRAAAGAGHRPQALVQVDLAGETTKHGAPPEALEAIFHAAGACTAVNLVGLMLLPPAATDPADVRPWFRKLGAVRAQLLASGVPQERLAQLSMGMSHDFEVAVEEGATIVRVGSAIFGARA